MTDIRYQSQLNTKIWNTFSSKCKRILINYDKMLNSTSLNKINKFSFDGGGCLQEDESNHLNDNNKHTRSVNEERGNETNESSYVILKRHILFNVFSNEGL